MNVEELNDPNLEAPLDQFVEELERFVESHRESGFEIGEFLSRLDNKLPKGIAAERIYGKAQIANFCKARLKARKKFYWVYSKLGYDPTKLKGIKPTHAAVLAEMYRPGDTYVRARTTIKDTEFIYPHRKAVELVLSKTVSREALDRITKDRLDCVPPFANENEIERFFRKKEEEFRQGRGLEKHWNRAAAGPAVGDIDHAWTKTDDQGAHYIVLIELKDVVIYEDVGEVLGQQNELKENIKDGEAVLYPLYMNRPDKYSCENTVHVPCDFVETWLIGQVFADSVYYAAKGQDISLFRLVDPIDINNMIGPLNAKNMTEEDWVRFAGKLDGHLHHCP